jgi:hypothetical protein
VTIAATAAELATYVVEKGKPVITLYWFTGTATSAAWMYWESAGPPRA